MKTTFLQFLSLVLRHSSHPQDGSGHTPRTTLRGRTNIAVLSCGLLFLICSPSPVPAAQFPNFKDLYNGVAKGFGVNPNAADPREILKGTAIIFTDAAEGVINRGEFTYDLYTVREFSDLMLRRSASAEMQGRFLMYSGKASFEVNVASRKTSDSIMWIVTADKDYGIREKIENVRLTPVAEARWKNDGYASFVRQFGTHFISSWSRTARLAVIFEAYNLTQQDEQHVNTMIQASASFLAGNASAKATMTSARSSLSSTSKTRVHMTADGIDTDNYFRGITDLTALDQIQAGTIRLLADFDSQKGNVNRYYTTAYADVIPGFPLPEPVLILSEQDKAQAAFEQAYVVKLQIDNFRKGPRGPFLDAKELAYLNGKNAECDARLSQIANWLKVFKADATLKARSWPPIEVQLPELIWYSAQPIYFRDADAFSPVMVAYISGGAEIGSLNWDGVDGQHQWNLSVGSYSIWPSANNIQPLDTPEKLDQTRGPNGSLRRWVWNHYWQVTSETFEQRQKGRIGAYLKDKDGNVINYAKDRYGRYAVESLGISLGQEPWPGTRGNDALQPTFGLGRRSFLGISKPIDGANFQVGQNIEVETTRNRWDGNVEFLLDNAKLPPGTGYKYTLNNVSPGTHQLAVVPTGNTAPPQITLGPITFTVTSPPTLPAITAQPASLSVGPGNSAAFSVTATGTAPLSYLWYRNGEEVFDNQRISGSASGTLRIASVTAADQASYTVVVSNQAGQVTSASAALTVIAAQTRVIRISGELGFGDVQAGKNSQRSFTIYNDGNANLTVTTISYPSGFSGNWNGGTVAPGSSQQIAVVFAPTAQATYGGEIVVNSDKTSGTSTISVSGRGTPAAVTRYTLSLSVNPSGSGTISANPPPESDSRYASGAVVNLTTTPAAGFRFASWAGDVAGTASTTTININGDKNVTANFVRETTAGPAFVRRQLPSGYVPGSAITVTLQADPTAATTSYVVEDQPPDRWTVSNVSHSGAFDSANRKVKFGPFFDATSRSLTYHVMPPSTESGIKIFSGTASADGVDSAIAGDVQIDTAQFHPADSNPGDWAIKANEITSYGAAWKRGNEWPVGPNPITPAYISRAGALWKGGETYKIDPSVSSGPPLWWVNVARAPQSLNNSPLPIRKNPPAASSAVSSLPATFTPGAAFAVSIAVTPAPDVFSYVVEDQPPAGWTVSGMSQGGSFDVTNRKVKWGPYFDNTARILTYETTPPYAATGKVNFSGIASFDGVDILIGGQRTSSLGDQGAVSISSLQLTSDGEVQFMVSAPLDAKCTVEYSADLGSSNWRVLSSFVSTSPTTLVRDASKPRNEARFYRIKVEP